MPEPYEPTRLKVRGHSRRRTALSLAVAVLLVAVGCSSDDTSTADAGSSDGESGSSSQDGGTIEIKVALPVPLGRPGGPQGVGIESWMDQVEAEANGGVKFTVYDSGSLLSTPEGLPGTRDGRTQIGFSSSVLHPDLLPLTSVVATPFVTNDTEAVVRAMTQIIESDDALAAEWEQLGLRPLFFTLTGGTVMGSSSVVDDLDDLRGNRFRAGGHMATAMQAGGASGVFVDIAELHQSLQQGVVDGFVGLEFGSAVSLGFHEAAQHFTDPGIGVWTLGAYFIQVDLWESLPDDVKEIMESASIAAIDEQVAATLEINSESCERFTESGGTIVPFPAEDVEQWKADLGDEILEDLRKEAADRGVSEEDFDRVHTRYLTLIEELEGAGTYIDPLQACAEEQSG